MKKASCIIISLLIITAASLATFASQIMSIKTGDIDSDGNITIVDATFIQRHCAEIILLSSQQLSASDTDCDSKITVLDATYIQFFLAQFISELPHKSNDPSIQPTQTSTDATCKYADYFSQDKRVVFIGDSFTQGLGSSDYVLYETTDNNYNSIIVTGNGPEYGIKNNIPQYVIGTKLYQTNAKQWYESIDGNGYAHNMIKILNENFSCCAKNHGMSGITSGTLLKQIMNTSNTELDLSGLKTDAEGNVKIFSGLTNGFDTVFLTIGGNDRSFEDIDGGKTAIEQFEYNLNYIVSSLKDDNKNIILMSMTPCKDDYKVNIPMKEIDETIEKVAQKYDVVFISIYKDMLDYCKRTNTDIDTLRHSDGLHPNNKGYEVVTSIICKNLGIYYNN